MTTAPSNRCSAVAVTPAGGRKEGKVLRSKAAPVISLTLPPPNIPQPALGKLGTLVHLMSRSEGAALHELCDATGWQAHSVRGALSGSLKRKRGYAIASDKIDGVRRYRIANAGGEGAVA